MYAAWSSTRAVSPPPSATCLQIPHAVPASGTLENFFHISFHPVSGAPGTVNAYVIVPVGLLSSYLWFFFFNFATSPNLKLNRKWRGWPCLKVQRFWMNASWNAGDSLRNTNTPLLSWGLKLSNTKPRCRVSAFTSLCEIYTTKKCFFIASYFWINPCFTTKSGSRFEIVTQLEDIGKLASSQL
jgi:hypothetical protein